MPCDRLTRFSAVGENASHVQCDSNRTKPDSAFSRPSRSPLHLVSAPDEEAPRRRQPVRPLHLPEMRLPAHDQTRPKTTKPRALVPLSACRPKTGRPDPIAPFPLIRRIRYSSARDGLTAHSSIPPATVSLPSPIGRSLRLSDYPHENL